VDFEFSARTRDYLQRLGAFMDEHIYPNEERFYAQLSEGDRWEEPALLAELRHKAQAARLWNLFLPDSHHGAGLSNLEYAPLCEMMGRVRWSSEVFNCSAPDTGNMETLERYGTPAQKKQWLEPLLDGSIRSAFAMTEPGVASSDATNIESSIVRDGASYLINGRKWWTSGAGSARCRLFIFMGKTDPGAPPHQQQSMILVPRDTAGVTILRHLPVFGFDDAPHGHMEIEFKDVRVPAENLLLGEGRGFEIAQGRLGPGRIHHAMRLIGVAEQARLLVYKAAWLMDKVGNKAARAEIAMIKTASADAACQVIDWAIQAHGAAGLCDDYLANAYAQARAIRLADGPDEVHRNQIGRLELDKYP
jgi:acyl-CoA dehydrogenase